MSEPIYTYVRGKGWLATLDSEYEEITVNDFKIVNRRPSPGEKFIMRSNWDFQKFADFAAVYYYREFLAWDPGDVYRDEFDSSFNYVTLIPVLR